MKTARGFTLLEVMIVLTIMAVLMLYSNQSIQQAIRNKVKIQTTNDEMSQVRDSLRVIEKDINLAFHYRDLEKELLELAKKQNVPTTTTIPGAPPPDPSSPPVVPPPNPNDPLELKTANRADPSTHFIGTEEDLYFVTSNTGRLVENVAQADFIKVGYLLKTCRKPGQKTESECLIRRTSNIVEGDLTKGGKDIVLLEDISEFKLRYFGQGKQDWNTTWNSVSGDAATKDRYPDAVEISLSVSKPTPGASADKKKKISMQFVVPIRFANNPKAP